MRGPLFFLFMILIVPDAFAFEFIRGSNYMTVDAQKWKTGDETGYWMINSRGVSEMIEGPFETSPIECHGAGFWGKSGAWGEGICVYGNGEDTRTMAWQVKAGEETNTWFMVGGTGQYAGITGQGTYVSKNLSGGREVSRFEGNVDLPKQ